MDKKNNLRYPGEFPTVSSDSAHASETKMKMISSGSSSISCVCSPIRDGEDGDIGIGSSSETVIGGEVVLFEPTRRWNEVECSPRESALST
jgi:hypothetical protein